MKKLTLFKMAQGGIRVTRNVIHGGTYLVKNSIDYLKRIALDDGIPSQVDIAEQSNLTPEDFERREHLATALTSGLVAAGLLAGGAFLEYQHFHPAEPTPVEITTPTTDLGR